MWQGKGGNKPGKDKDPKKDPRKFIDSNPARPVERTLEVAGGSGLSRQEREAALAKQILVYHESKPADTGNDWMYKLKEESMEFLAEQKGVQLQEIYRDAIYK
ncbi:MAG: hypothetical protein ACRD3W_17450, partial [Terriglobales bacterium]